MQEAIRHWQQIVESSDMGVAVISTTGDFIYINTAYRHIFRMDETIKNVFELVTPGREDEMHELLADTLSGKTKPLFQARSKRHDTGEWCDVKVTAHPFFDEQGEPIGCVILLYDVTREMDMHRLKDELLAISVHDLRTPLTVIRGRTQSLLRRIGKYGLPTQEQLTKELQEVERSTDKLMDKLDTLVEQFRSNIHE